MSNACPAANLFTNLLYGINNNYLVTGPTSKSSASQGLAIIS